MSDWNERIDWEKLTKSINGYYSTTLTPDEVERVFKSAIDPIEQRIAALESRQHGSDRDAFGRKRKDRA